MAVAKKEYAVPSKFSYIAFNVCSAAIAGAVIFAKIAFM